MFQSMECSQNTTAVEHKILLICNQLNKESQHKIKRKLLTLEPFNKMNINLKV
jgi:hypothetical protein